MSQVLVYGNISYLDLVKQKLRSLSDFRVIHVDAGIPQAKKRLSKLEARLMIYDRKMAGADTVTTFWSRNPYSPVLDLGVDQNRDLVVICREYSRLETSGLPQVLQALEEL
jgi:hypothetical protein